MSNGSGESVVYRLTLLLGTEPKESRRQEYDTRQTVESRMEDL